MAGFAKEKIREALESISTLKRAIGIPNHPTKRDAFEAEKCHIYTTDKASAELLGELLFRSCGGARKDHQDASAGLSIADTIETRQLEDDCYDVSISIIHPPSFAKALKRMADKHISPDRYFRR